MGTATAYGYDAMGRIVQDWEQTPSISPGGFYVLSNFDLVGNLVSTTDAAGTVITYGHDGASRITTITSSLNDANHPRRCGPQAPRRAITRKAIWKRPRSEMA